jgi:hypothetical protein
MRDSYSARAQALIDKHSSTHTVLVVLALHEDVEQ